MEPNIRNDVAIELVCRLCANLQDERLIPLFEGEGQEKNLPDRISKYLDFSVHMKKGLPTSVCVQCTYTLLNWHRFYKNCEKINEHFRAMVANEGFKGHPLEEGSGDIAGEEIVEFDDESLSLSVLKETEGQELKDINELMDDDEEGLVGDDQDHSVDEDEPQHQEKEPQEKVKSGRRKLPSPAKPQKAKKPKLPVTGKSPRSLSCLNCDQSFTSKVELKKHKVMCAEGGEDEPQEVTNPTGPRSHPPGHMNLNCPICDAPFNRKFNREQHLTSHTKDVPCRICSLSFRSENALQGHLVQAHSKQEMKKYLEISQRYVECPKCPGVKFPSYYGLYYHDLSEHSDGSVHRCEFCDLFFYTKKQLSGHIKKKHTVGGEEQEDRRCNECGKIFASKQTLAQHMRTHTGSKPIKCDECGEAFRAESAYRQHRISQHDESPFQCALCGQTFSRSNYLRMHLKNHLSGKGTKAEK